MKKKIVIALLIGSTIMSISACGKGNSASTSQQTTATITETPSVTETPEITPESLSDSSSVMNDSSTPGNVIQVDTSEDTEIKAPTVLDYGFVVIEGYDSYYIEYAYEIKNENNVDIEFPTVKITAKDDSGAILASEEDVRGYIAAGDTIAQASQISCDSMPASIEIVGVVPDDYNVVSNSSGRSSADFTISNASLQGDSVTGEITNNSTQDYDDGFVATAIFRDSNGNIVTGATDYYTNKISAGETTTFEINCMFDPSEYSFETITVTAYGESY